MIVEKPANWDDLSIRLKQLIQQDHLPATFFATVETYYLPLAAAIAQRQQQEGRCLLVAINGAQGTGKSTLAEFLQVILDQAFALP